MHPVGKIQRSVSQYDNLLMTVNETLLLELFNTFSTLEM